MQPHRQQPSLANLGNFLSKNSLAPGGKISLPSAWLNGELGLQHEGRVARPSNLRGKSKSKGKGKRKKGGTTGLLMKRVDRMDKILGE